MGNNGKILDQKDQVQHTLHSFAILFFFFCPCQMLANLDTIFFLILHCKAKQGKFI